MSEVKEDASDAFSFWKNPKNKEKTENDEEWIPPRPQMDQDADFYVMDPEKKNIAVIFNHHDFSSYQMSRRDGTIKDAEDLTATLQDLNFDVKTYTDLKYGAIHEVLKQLALLDHSNTNCLVIATLTHGDTGTLQAKDHEYPTDTLWMLFTGDKCPTLTGKPKIFFIQAGTDAVFNPFSRSALETAQPARECINPSMADVLVMYSTCYGFHSWRDPASGSWFIQSLCKELKQRARHFDLQTILTFVNRRVATQYTSNVPGNPHMHCNKQIGSMVSSLTRLLYFYPPSDV